MRRSAGMRRGDARPPTADWPARLAKIRVGSLAKGTGWAVGDTGVLTAYDVISPMLGADGTPTPDGAVLAEIVMGAATGRSFSARVQWADERRGLAMLQITDANQLTWRTALRSAASIPLAYPGVEPVPEATLWGLPAKSSAGSESSTVAWMLAAPLSSRGTLFPGPDRGELAALEMTKSSLPRHARRHPMAGAIVLGPKPHPSVLGVVARRPRGRGTRRFEVRTLPDPADDPEFAGCLDDVGAGAVIHRDGPLFAQFLRADSLGDDLLPRAVAEAQDAGWFGTRRARSDITAEDQPYFAWVERPERAQLTAAIDAALAGTGPRVIVLRGPSAAGKSRLAAKVVLEHAGLAEYQLMAPRAGRDILDLPRHLWPERAVLWLDNLDQLPATALRHEALRALLQERPDLIVVGTVLHGPQSADGARLVDSGATRSSHRPRPDAPLPLSPARLSPVQCLIDDEALALSLSVASHPRWATSAADRSAWAVARATKHALGLGEYLSGYRELADHYTAATWPTRALIDLVADWTRSGIGAGLPLETARDLWKRGTPARLPRSELRAFQTLSAAERTTAFEGALRYATESLFGGQPLIVAADGKLWASEFCCVHLDGGALDSQLWDYLVSTSPATPAQRLGLGIRALGSGTGQRALRAFESVLYFRDDDELAASQRPLVEALARRGVALYHAQGGRHEQAVMVLTDLVDTFASSDDDDVAEQAAYALLGIGIIFSDLGSAGQAASAYGELLQRYRARTSPIFRPLIATALLGQAGALSELGRSDEEAAAYRDLVARFADDPGTSMAMMIDIARAGLAASQP